MFHYSRGKDKYDNLPAQHCVASWEDFAQAVLADVSSKKGQAFICAPMAKGLHSNQEKFQGENHWRQKHLATPRRWHPLDVDFMASAEVYNDLRMYLSQYRGFGYTTASHTPDNPRCRPILILDRPVTREEGQRLGEVLVAAITAELTRIHGEGCIGFDDSVHNGEQPCYLPVQGFESFRLTGEPVEVDTLLGDWAPAPEVSCQTSNLPMNERHAELVRRILTGDIYHDSLRDLAASLIRCGMASGAVVEHLRGLMMAADVPRDARFNERLRDIPRLCDDAVGKFGQADITGLLKPTEQVPRTANAADLLTKEFKPVQWAVESILPEGVTILSGDPKIGKSWLVYQACIAVATGSPLWPGREPETKGDALMLALEDNDRRLQRRLTKLLPTFIQINGSRISTPTVERLHYATEWPRAEAGVKAIAEWLRQHPEARMVVIDTVSAFRDPEPGKKSAYAHDYAVGEMLKPLAREFSCAIVLVMHNRKAQSDDPLQMVSGTQGITGSVDNVLVMRRDRGNMDAALYVDGRDIEEQQEIALKFNEGKWTSVGTLEEAQRSKERVHVIEVIEELGGRAKAKPIADALGKKYGTVRTMLSRMVKAGDLTYHAGEYSPHTSSNSGNTVTTVAA